MRCLVLALLAIACGESSPSNEVLPCSREERQADYIVAFTTTRSDGCGDREPEAVHLGLAPEGCESLGGDWTDDNCGLAAAYRCPTFEAKHSTVIDPVSGTIWGVYTELDATCGGSWDVVGQR